MSSASASQRSIAPSPHHHQQEEDESHLCCSFRGRNIPVTRSSSVPLDIARQALDSHILQRWIRRCEAGDVCPSHGSRAEEDRAERQSEKEEEERLRLQVHGIELQSVDRFGSRIGFIKLQSQVSLLQNVDDAPKLTDHGTKAPQQRSASSTNYDDACSTNMRTPTFVPGICFLRGDSVAILVSLVCGEESYGVVVEQPRVPIGCAQCLELPAGMMEYTQPEEEEEEEYNGVGTRDVKNQGNHADDDQDASGRSRAGLRGTSPLGRRHRHVTGTAIQELQEECGILINSADNRQLIDLTELAGACDGLTLSPGACDERIRLMFLEKSVTTDQLQALQGRLTGLRDQGELITLRIVPMDDLWRMSMDAKAMLALFLIERLRSQGSLPPMGDLAIPLTLVSD